MFSQPCFARDRIPQLAFQALDFGICLGVFQRDQRLSGAHNIAVSDQNLPDDTALQVLNRLAARLGFDTTTMVLPNRQAERTKFSWNHISFGQRDRESVGRKSRQSRPR
jgi:hypothetical protein